MDLGVVPLEDRLSDAFEIFPGPVDLKWSRDRFHESFVSFEHFQRPRDAAHREKCRVRGAASGIGVSQTFPIRKRAGPGDAQRIECRSAYGKSIGRFLAIQTQSLGNAGRDRVRSLCRVVESLVADGSNVAQPALDLISYRQSCQEFFTSAVRVFAGSQYREIVTRMAGLVLCEIAVIEIQ